MTTDTETQPTSLVPDAVPPHYEYWLRVDDQGRERRNISSYGPHYSSLVIYGLKELAALGYTRVTVLNPGTSNAVEHAGQCMNRGQRPQDIPPPPGVGWVRIPTPFDPKGKGLWVTFSRPAGKTIQIIEAYPVLFPFINKAAFELVKAADGTLVEIMHLPSEF